MLQRVLNLILRLLAASVGIALLGWLAVLLWRSIEAQAVVRRYPQVEGEVTRSQYRETGSMMGYPFESEVEFKYQFGGQERTQRRIALTKSYLTAKGRMQDHPVGKKVPLLVNPANPAEILALSEAQGASGYVLFVPLLGVGAVLFMGGSLWESQVRLAWRETGGVKLTRTPQQTRVHLRTPRLDALQLGLPPMTMAPFAWWVAETVGFSPNEQGHAWLLGSVGLVGGAALMWMMGQGSSGITLNAGDRVLVLPEAGEAHGDLRVSYADVEAVTVERVEDDKSNRFTVSVRPRGKAAVPLERWRDQDRAEQFAAWLRQQLGLAGP